MSTKFTRQQAKGSLREQLMEVKRKFMQLYKAFEAFTAATDEEMQARPTKTEVAQMIGQAIEQATGQRVVHAEAAPTLERSLALVPEDGSEVRVPSTARHVIGSPLIPDEPQPAVMVAEDGEGPE